MATVGERLEFCLHSSTLGGKSDMTAQFAEPYLEDHLEARVEPLEDPEKPKPSMGMDGGGNFVEKRHGMCEGRGASHGSSSNHHKLSSTNLFIYDLPEWVDQAMLEKHFSEYGNIVSSAVMRNIHTGVSLGTAFVEFEKHEQAEKAIACVSGTALEGKTIFVQWAKKHERIPIGEARRKIKKLFVRNIPLNITVADLTSFFSEFGTVNSVTIHKDTAQVSDPLLVRRIAFVTYSEEGAAEKAANAVQNTKPFDTCKGIPLMVKLAEDSAKSRRQHRAPSSTTHGNGNVNHSTRYGYASPYPSPQWAGRVHKQVYPYDTTPSLAIPQKRSSSFHNTAFPRPSPRPYKGWNGQPPAPGPRDSHASGRDPEKQGRVTPVFVRHGSGSEHSLRAVGPYTAAHPPYALPPGAFPGLDAAQPCPGRFARPASEGAGGWTAGFGHEPTAPRRAVPSREVDNPFSDPSSALFSQSRPGKGGGSARGPTPSHRSHSSLSYQASQMTSLIFPDDLCAGENQIDLSVNTTPISRQGCGFEFDSVRGSVTPTPLRRQMRPRSQGFIELAEPRPERVNCVYVPHSVQTPSRWGPSGAPVRPLNVSTDNSHHANNYSNHAGGGRGSEWMLGPAPSSGRYAGGEDFPDANSGSVRDYPHGHPHRAGGVGLTRATTMPDFLPDEGAGCRGRPRYSSVSRTVSEAWLDQPGTRSEYACTYDGEVRGDYQADLNLYEPGTVLVEEPLSLGLERGYSESSGAAGPSSAQGAGGLLRRSPSKRRSYRHNPYSFEPKY